MYKKIVFLALVMLFVMSLSSFAYDTDYYYTAAEQFDNILDTTVIDNGPEHGQVNYDLVNALFYVDGTKQDSTLNHYLEFGYGLQKDTEFTFDLYSYPETDLLTYDLALKHKFMTKNDWTIAGAFYYAYDRGIYDYKTPAVKVFTDKVVNSNLILHNNLKLYFYENGDLGKTFENGLTYQADSQKTLKANLVSHTKDKLSDFVYHDLEFGLKSILDAKTTYTGYVYTRMDDIDTNDNVLFSNTVEYAVNDSLTLTGNVDFNTGENVNAEIYGKVAKELANKITLSGEYFKELNTNYDRLIARVEKELKNSVNIYGEYVTDLDGISSINTGCSYEF